MMFAVCASVSGLVFPAYTFFAYETFHSRLVFRTRKTQDKDFFVRITKQGIFCHVVTTLPYLDADFCANCR